jgi:hypothetical protein
MLHRLSGSFLPVEKAVLAEVIPDGRRTEAFARYTLTGACFISNLEVQFGSDLNDPRIAIASDSAEQAVRVGERSKGAGIGVIQHVGCFTAQLEAEAVAEQEIFGSRHVPVFIAGTAQHAASCVTGTMNARGDIRETGSIEP